VSIIGKRQLEEMVLQSSLERTEINRAVDVRRKAVPNPRSGDSRASRRWKDQFAVLWKLNAVGDELRRSRQMAFCMYTECGEK